MKWFFVIDTETYGLHGVTFAYGFVLITDAGEIVNQGWESSGFDASRRMDEDDRAWLVASTPQEVLYPAGEVPDLTESFWRAWMLARAQARAAGVDLHMTADVPWPCETGFLTECVKRKPARALHAPYPVIDVASVLLALGQDPLATTPRAAEDYPAHHPLHDARHSARQLVAALRRST